MPDKANPVFKLLQSQRKLVEKSYQLTLKRSRNNIEYLLLEPRKGNTTQTNQVILNIDSNNYITSDFHLSVYADLSCDNRYQGSSYHLTVNLVNDDEMSITARVYYDQYNKVRFVELKDSEARLIPFKEQEAIIQFSKIYTIHFSDLLWRIYDFTDQHFNKKYTESLQKLTEKSKYLGQQQTTPLSDLREYQQQLDQLIAQLEQWNRFELGKQPNLLRHFGKLKKQIAQKIQEATEVSSVDAAIEQVDLTPALNEPKTMPMAVAKEPTLSQLTQLNRELTALSKDETLSKCQKLISEHALLNKKFGLASGDEALECIIRCQELESLALRMLNEFLAGSHQQKKLQLTEVIALVKLIPRVDPAIFPLVVARGQISILTELLIHHPYININIAFTDKKRFLLDIAYEKKHLAIFKLLLQHGAFSDRCNKQDKTLLMRSCEERRSEEMVALLQAGASNYLKTTLGYTAFGILMHDNTRRPDVELVKLFMDHCQAFDIDYMQGPYRRKGTPFVFACQLGWIDVAKLLLEYGASPFAIREIDRQHALNICAFKGFTSLAKMILEHATYRNMDICCDNAFLTARKYKNHEVLSLLERYREQQKASCIEKKQRYFFPRNTSTAFVIDFFNEREVEIEHVSNWASIVESGISNLVKHYMERQKGASAVAKNMCIVSENTLKAIDVTIKPQPRLKNASDWSPLYFGISRQTNASNMGTSKDNPLMPSNQSRLSKK